MSADRPRSPALVLHLRTFVIRASSHIVSALEVMRLGTLTGSEAFYKPLALKDAVKRARLSENKGQEAGAGVCGRT